MFGGSGSWYYTSLAGMSRVPGSRSWANMAIAPPAGAILDDCAGQNLTSAAASIDSPMGLVAVSWQLQSGTAAGPCGDVAEHDTLTLTCAAPPAGAAGATPPAFTSVAFASFGTPTGSCSTGLGVNASCNAPTSAAVAAAACVGKSSCSILANVSVFGGVDPCYDTPKRLAVTLIGNCALPLYSMAITVPVGGVASVRVPTVQSAGGVTITEGGAVVFTAGAFVPGVAGISAGVALDDTAVLFSVGSGSYAFQVLG